jgi:hypothetical protein
LKLAWYLSTIPNQHPTEIAIQLARRAARTRSPQALDVLAAAYANAGDFANARATARQALELLKNDSQTRKEIEQRLDLYEKSRPYRLPIITQN